MTSKTLLRHHARRYAMQALYQWYFTHHDATDVIHQFVTEQDMQETDLDYFKELVSGTINHLSALDERLILHLDRKITALNPVELAVLRIAVFELTHRPDIPYKVVIDEAVELTKEFGAEQGYKYVNGVLDAVAKSSK